MQHEHADLSFATPPAAPRRSEPDRERAVASRAGPRPFRVAITPGRGRVRVTPVGELDLATVDELQAWLQELRDAGFRRLLIDLRELTFIDSSGLRLVITWNARANTEGLDFELIRGPAAIQRAFEICGLSNVLAFIDDDPVDTPAPHTNRSTNGMLLDGVPDSMSDREPLTATG